MISIYRYENSKNEGPYSASYGLNLNRKYKHIHCDEEHPNTYKDGITFKIKFNSKLVHGCSSLVKLKKWFSGYNKELKKNFNIYKYRVNKKDVTYGNSKKQVVFFKDRYISKEKI